MTEFRRICDRSNAEAYDFVHKMISDFHGYCEANNAQIHQQLEHLEARNTARTKLQVSAFDAKLLQERITNASRARALADTAAAAAIEQATETVAAAASVAETVVGRVDAVTIGLSKAVRALASTQRQLQDDIHALRSQDHIDEMTKSVDDA
jgi:hypothetical protein